MFGHDNWKEGQEGQEVTPVKYLQHQDRSLIFNVSWEAT